MHPLDSDRARAPSTAEKAELFRRLEGKRVTIDYTNRSGARTVRTIIPICLSGLPPHSVRASCLLRQEERTFRLDRIAHAWGERDALDGDLLVAVARMSPRPTPAAPSAAKVLVWSILGCLLSLLVWMGGCSQITPKSIHVSGYTRSDGRHVSSYNRRPAGSRSKDAPWTVLGAIGFLGTCGFGVAAYFAAKALRERRLSGSPSRECPQCRAPLGPSVSRCWAAGCDYTAQDKVE